MGVAFAWAAAFLWPAGVAAAAFGTFGVAPLLAEAFLAGAVAAGAFGTGGGFCLAEVVAAGDVDGIGAFAAPEAVATAARFNCRQAFHFSMRKLSNCMCGSEEQGEWYSTCKMLRFCASHTREQAMHSTSATILLV